MEQRRPDTPAPDAGPPPDAANAPDDGVQVPGGGLPPDAEHRPLGALAVVSFLTLTIMVSWFGMFALNIVRN